MTEAVNRTCPWSGKPVQPDSLARYRDHVVGFCNPDCRDKFARAVDHFDAAIAGNAAARTLLQMAGASLPATRLDEATLVLIDAQEEYRTGALPLDGIDAAIARLAELLARARRSGTPVIHVVHRGRPGGLFDPGGSGGAILADLQPSSGETVLGKALPNAFAGTDLDARLRETGRAGLVLAGFMTHMCVSSTARAALDLGHRVTIAADATATRALPDPLGGADVPAAQVQRAALAALADRFASVVSSAAIAG